MMDSMLQKNQEAAEQIRNNQKLLRNQLLQMLLDGCAFVEVASLSGQGGDLPARAGLLCDPPFL